MPRGVYLRKKATKKTKEVLDRLAVALAQDDQSDLYDKHVKDKKLSSQERIASQLLEIANKLQLKADRYRHTAAVLLGGR